MSTRSIGSFNVNVNGNTGSNRGRLGARPAAHAGTHGAVRGPGSAWIVPLALIAIIVSVVFLLVTAYQFVQPVLTMLNNT